MTETQQFIEDAIKGGWGKNVFPDHWDLTDSDTIAHEVILLTAEAWQAVSKTRNWNQGNYRMCPCCEMEEMTVDWRYYMHEFIESIAMGKTIEEALVAIK